MFMYRINVNISDINISDIKILDIKISDIKILDETGVTAPHQLLRKQRRSLQPDNIPLAKQE